MMILNCGKMCVFLFMCFAGSFSGYWLKASVNVEYTTLDSEVFKAVMSPFIMEDKRNWNRNTLNDCQLVINQIKISFPSALFDTIKTARKSVHGCLIDVFKQESLTNKIGFTIAMGYLFLLPKNEAVCKREIDDLITQWLDKFKSFLYEVKQENGREVLTLKSPGQCKSTADVQNDIKELLEAHSVAKMWYSHGHSSWYKAKFILWDLPFWQFKCFLVLVLFIGIAGVNKLIRGRWVAWEVK